MQISAPAAENAFKVIIYTASAPINTPCVQWLNEKLQVWLGHTVNRQKQIGKNMPSVELCTENVSEIQLKRHESLLTISEQTTS